MTTRTVTLTQGPKPGSKHHELSAVHVVDESMTLLSARCGHAGHPSWRTWTVELDALLNDNGRLGLWMCATCRRMVRADASRVEPEPEELLEPPQEPLPEPLPEPPHEHHYSMTWICEHDLRCRLYPCGIGRWVNRCRCGELEPEYPTEEDYAGAARRDEAGDVAAVRDLRHTVGRLLEEGRA